MPIIELSKERKRQAIQDTREFFACERDVRKYMNEKIEKFYGLIK